MILGRSLALAFIALLAPLAGCSAPTDDAGETSDKLAGNQSAYTPLGENDHCEVLSEVKEGEDVLSVESNCGGMGGYEILVNDGDERQMVTIRTPTGDYDLELYKHLPAMGYLGNKAEWRGKALAIGKVDPTALIFRYFTPTEQQSNKSSLVVAKLTKDGACITSVVGGNQNNGNVIAQQEANKTETMTCAPMTPRPLAPAGCGVITPGTGIGMDRAVTSCLGKYSLVMQTDGNLVVYNNTKGRAIWQSHTAGSVGTAAILRPDGSFGIFGKAWDSVWSPGATLDPKAELHLQDDGNLVLYSEKGKVLWATWTQGK